MNKLFTKIAGLSLGLAMAIGVGVAVANSEKEATPVHASAAWVAHTGAITAGNEYLIVSVSGTYSMNPKNTTSSGTTTAAAGGYSATSFTAATGPDMGFVFADAGDNHFYIKDGACFVRANGTTNNGLASATSNSTNPTYGTWIVTETSTSGQYTLINTNGTGRQISLYGTTNWRSYGTTSGSKTNVKLYEKSATPQTITVDPSSKEAYTDETFSLTTNATSASWALSNNTCGASLSAASGKTVTVSATGAGSVRVTATASGYTSPYVDLTFSERPTSPYITPEKSSTSGYTGMDETISVTYGNLTSGLAVSSNNTSVVDASIDYDDEDGNADILLEFNGAGSTTVSLKDGSTQLATISVSVTASNVTITGLPSTGKAFIGNTLDLGATITVTATGSMGKSVTWSSGTTSVATVSSTGIVTGIKEGTSVITVTSVSKPSVSMSCTVSVEEQAVYTLVTDPSTLADGTQFVLVDYVSSTYRIAKDLNSGHIKMNTVTSATTISGTTSGSTVITEEADVFTLVGSSGAWEIMRGDTYLQFTGTSNGNDSFTDTSSADTKFSIVTSSTSNKLTINSNSRSNRALRYNTSTGDLRNYVNTGSQPDLYMYAIIPAQNELDHVTTSGQTTSFTAGNTFSYGGTLTAYYTIDDPATKTPTSFKLDSESGATITTSTVLTKAAHDGHEIYVLYTEDNITKSAHYTITVGYAAVTSVVIDQHASEIGLEELYDGYKTVGVTVNSQYADQGYEWIVSANTVDDDYLFDASGLLSGNTEGTITLRCRSTADNSKYDELVVTVTGDPTAEFTPASVSGYVGKSDDIAFTYGNMSDTSLISITSSNSSIAEVDEFVAEEGEGLVTVNFVAAGSATLSISYDGGSTLDSITVTVSADSVTALTWSAPTIKVYSGATTTVSDASSWNVHYTMASGDYGSLVYGEYTLKLGESSITLPHTWDASEDGKVLSIEYGGFASPTTTTVDVTQTIQAVNADIQSEPVVSDLTFSAACGGSGTADDGASWSITSDGTESNWISGAGIHYGTNSASVTYIQLDNSDIAPTDGNKTITKIEVNARDAQDNATLSVTVGGNAFGTSKSLTNTSTAYTFEGSAKGAIQVKSERTESMKKALYVLFVKVTYVTSSGTANIANVAGHEVAQKAVVAFAKAMNAAFDNTENCTDGVATAWTTASNAYSSNITNNASLSADEKAYAKNLIKYASAQYTDNTDNDYSYCLERAMATYEACIQKHGQNAFMSDVRPVSASPRITSLSFINGSGNTVAIIVIISMISVAAIGGYFLFRKKKED
ncbi:MAG: Ig-like domain-containing protein [Bacilli bacterium]|nr:Ig-like domain-containing protein [Bacilli bacterium]